MHRYLLLCLTLSANLVALADELPKSVDPRLKVELFAEHPQIVTPTGLDVDYRGRVFAIESNTHFPPEGYKGHPTDRVLVMSDTDSDGKADKITVFTDGLKFSMSVVVRPLWYPVPVAKDAPAPKQSVYIATRAEIFQFHDDDGDDKADRKESIVRLDTKGNYPHNGLAGFAIDALGWMYFGFGENLGADYKIIGSDGTTLGGGGEGGNIYRCRLDGSKLSQIATGFWNPHANCFDAFGRLFSVDNDPDSRPPCRLLHVIPGGDYGYRFRNGRKGLHPFTSWNGEIPGTLPMVAGTGEAPSGILAYESDGLPEEYLGNLLVTSWGDHRIDRFRLQPKGTSFTSLAEPLITGGENFRPVGIATAPDGSLFCTDWVLRDYKLHGHGRIWKISRNDSKAQNETIDLASLRSRPAEKLGSLLQSLRMDVRRMTAKLLRPEAALFEAKFVSTPETLRGSIELAWAATELNHEVIDRALLAVPTEAESKQVRPFAERIIGERMSAGSVVAANQAELGTLLSLTRFTLNDPLILSASALNDPFIDAVLIRGLSQQFSLDDISKYLIADTTPVVKTPSARVRQIMLLAARKQAPRDERLLAVALADADPEVRRLAVQWAAEEKLVAFKPRVEAIFDSKGMTTELFLATIAALEMLDGKKPEDFDKTPAALYVVPLLKDEKRSPAVRAQALRLVSPTDKALDAPFFASLLKTDHQPLRVEVIRTLQGAKPEVSGELLRALVADEKLDVALRAEALVGLAAIAKAEPVGGPTRKLLKGFLTNSSAVPLRFEALRAARPLIADDAELRDAVLDVAKTIPLLSDGRNAMSLSDQVALAFAEAKLEVPQPIKLNSSAKPTSRQEWMDQLARGGNVDPAAGRRIFFHPNGPGCFKCHTIDGRGGKVGPDLSRAVGNMNRVQLIQSILEPSREIAPQYVAWTFEMKDGRVVTGMVVHENEGKTIVGDPEGKLTEIKTHDVETRTPQKTSVMPEKLADKMTLQELRDLLAFLDAQR